MELLANTRRFLTECFNSLMHFLNDEQRWRLSLIAVAIVLQSVIDLPFPIMNTLLGSYAPYGIFAFLLLSLCLLFFALAAPPHLGQGIRKGVTIGVLSLTLATGTFGSVQLMRSIWASFTHSVYSNDGTTLDHYAAMMLLQNKDPYTNSSMVAALRTLNQQGQYTTPLHLGPFATYSWLHYPADKDLRYASLHAPAYPADAAPEFESHVSYPAFSFLPLVPLVWAGLPSVVLFSVISLGIFAYFALKSVDPSLRLLLGLLILADVPVLDSTFSATLDVTVMALVFLMWLWWERAPIASTVMMGLAISTKQQGWFFALFFLVFLWQRAGWQSTLKRLAGASAVFLTLNLPFMLANFHAWLAGVLAPLLDPMFPRGRGLIQLPISHILPLWSTRVYTALELLALVLGLAWYAWRGAKHYPELGLLLAMVPFWFAWRSLTSYFFFVAIPMVALWLIWRHSHAAETEPSVSQPQASAKALVESLS